LIGFVKSAALIFVAVAFLCASAIAAAEEISAESYKAMVEPICQRDSNANKKDLKNVKRDVKRGKLKLAAVALTKASAALNKAYTELKVVPEPTASEATLAKWLGYVKKEAVLLSQTGRALKADKKSKASHDETQLDHYANLANSTVFSFNFHYCRFEPSKYT
jgi:hypothetical protein